MRAQSLDRWAFGSSASILVGFVLWAVFDLTTAKAAIEAASGWVGRHFGAFWQVLTLASTVVGWVLAFGPHGGRRLGGSAPEMSTARWIAIILCTLLAGGGVFWSAAEPMFHFQSPPPTFGDVEAESLAAVDVALAQSFLHWGFLAWSVVGTLGAIALMLLQEEKAMPFRPCALLVPWLGARALGGPLASLVDGLAIVATAAGTIGPIGFLGLQLAYAFEVLLGIPNTWASQLVVLSALVGVATLSAVTGIDRGIQWLSRFNVVLALGLGAVILLVGPTAFIVDHFLGGMGLYLGDFVRLATFRADPEWLGSWTVFYWGWFIGYGPLMSLFVARISRGRTVREIILAVGIVAPILTNLWFSTLGGTGLFFELQTPGSVTDALASDGLPAALLAIVEQLPGAGLWIPAFIVLIFVFLATSADSMAYAISMIVTRQETPPALYRAFYAVAMGAVAGALILMGEGSIHALQSFIVVTALPVSLLMATLVFTVPGLLARSAVRR